MSGASTSSDHLSIGDSQERVKTVQAEAFNGIWTPSLRTTEATFREQLE
jgi:hypothetical protein